MLAACFGIRAPPAEVGHIFLPRYIFRLIGQPAVS